MGRATESVTTSRRTDHFAAIKDENLVFTDSKGGRALQHNYN